MAKPRGMMCGPNKWALLAPLDHGPINHAAPEWPYRDAVLMSIGEGTNDILCTVVAKSLMRSETVIG